MNHTGCVYVYYNRINGKRYVGKANSQACFLDRKSKHKRGNGGAKVLWRAICKYGIESFDIYKIISGIPASHASYWETIYISLLKPEYNLTEGGEGTGGYKWTEEQKRYGDKNPNYGKKASKETSKLMSINRKRYEETQSKLYEAAKLVIEKGYSRREACNEVFGYCGSILAYLTEHLSKLGVKPIDHSMSKRTRNKLSKSHSGKTLSKEHRRKISESGRDPKTTKKFEECVKLVNAGYSKSKALKTVFGYAGENHKRLTSMLNGNA